MSRRDWLYPPFDRKYGRGQPRFDDIGPDFEVLGYEPRGRGAKLQFKCEQAKSLKIRTQEIVQKCRTDKLVGFYTLFAAQYKHLKSLHKQCKTLVNQLSVGESVSRKKIKELEEKLSKALPVYELNNNDFYVEFGARKPKYQDLIDNSIEQQRVDSAWF